ncbi:MAG: hypothetical protein NQ127_01930 [Candidatus Cardinium sp.]|nr:hypothetical protein [Candidatus Cardinium sp.]
MTLCNKLHIRQVNSVIIHTKEEINNNLQGMHFPLIIRPSYIIGGSSVRIMKNYRELHAYLENKNDNLFLILCEEYMKGFKEVKMDGIWLVFMEQIEPIGIHSGDSTALSN